MAHETFSRDESPQGSSDRAFGLVFFGFFLILAVLSYFSKLPFYLNPATVEGCPFWSSHPEAAKQAWALSFATVSLIFLLLALFIPIVLSPLNWVWTQFGLLLHRIVSPIVLGALFFLVFTPLGVMMRLFGGDPLRLRLDAEAKSYWIERTPPGPAPDSLKNQF